MHAGFRATVTLGKAEVDKKDRRLLLPDTNAQVFGLEIAMDKVLLVHDLNALN